MFPRKTVLFITFVLVLTIVSTLIAGCGGTKASQATWGRAEAKEVDINSKIPGRVVALLVKEGDMVKKGQLLARIDSRDITAQSDQAKANIKALEAQTAQASSVTELQDQTAKAALNKAKAQLEKAKSDLNLAESDYNRFKELVETGAISKQVFDTYRTKYQVAQAAYSQASAAVAAAEAGLLQTQVNTANEAAVRSKVVQARAALQQIEVNLDETEIRAPFDGIVTAKYIEEGSMISQGTPLVAIQDPVDNWVSLKVPETQLSNYYLNQEIELVARDGNTKIKGTITDISKKSEFATQRATSERGDESDIIAFNVKIQTNSDKVRPGMRFRPTGGAL